MSQVRPSFIQEVRETLEKSCFTVHDFAIELPESGRTLLKITFLHRPEFSLTLFEDERSRPATSDQTPLPGSRGGPLSHTVYSITAAPGRFKLETTSEVADAGLLLGAIPQWCEDIRADLYALSSSPDPLEQMRAEINANLDRLLANPSGHFTEKELLNVDRQFDKLYQEMVNLKRLSNQQLTKIKSEVDEFKKSARAYPRGTWAKITSNRLVKATEHLLDLRDGQMFLFQRALLTLGVENDAY